MLDALLELFGRLVIGLLTMFLSPPDIPGWLIQIFVAAGLALIVALVAVHLTSDDRLIQLSALVAFVTYILVAWTWMRFRTR